MTFPTVANASRAARLVGEAIVWDNHGCMPLRSDATFLPQLERYRAAGVTVASLNIGFADMTWQTHLETLSYMRGWIARRPEQFRLISTVADVAACKADGKLGITFDIEGMVPVEDRPDLVQTFYELGVRWMLIAYNQNNKAGGGCMDEDIGLTDIGRVVIDEMERVGMVLCLSHAGKRTALEAIEHSTHPTIFSHSNPFADHAHVRNVDDEIMRACAAKGGVVGLSGIGPFLGSSENLVDRLLQQLRYVIDLVGPDHVGLGLDFVFDLSELEDYVRTNPNLFPEGVEAAAAMIPPEAIGTIAEGLAKTNLSDAAIRGVLGGNWLRVASQVWR